MDFGFIRRQRDAQSLYFAGAAPVDATRPEAPWRLQEECRALNLAPSIREAMASYFGPPHNIVWHRHASHGLSSQVCCLNFLGPLARHPRLLSKIIGRALGIDPPTMLPVESGPCNEPWFVGFEWTGVADYLGEWRAGAASTTRGANATSADAVVRFRHAGSVETVLIEWKYTESYSAPLSTGRNETRVARYSNKIFSPAGPIKSDLGLRLEDFFWEPLYQLVRQQMLAWRMEKEREGDSDKVRVLHISPIGNKALHRVTAPALRLFGNDVFDVFRAALDQPDRFVARATHDVFGPFVDGVVQNDESKDWADYLRLRYGDLLKTC